MNQNGNQFSSDLQTQMFGQQEFRARTGRWLDSALAWLEREAASGLASEDLLQCFARLGLFSKMSPACYPLTPDTASLPSFAGWKNSGMAFRGAALTLNTLEFHSDAIASSLSEVLEPCVAQKYYLSAKACAGILRRAEKRGKELPEQLRAALTAVARMAQGEPLTMPIA